MDLNQLSNMSYSGRSIAIGMTPDETPFVAYTVTGRSPSSQARILKEENENIKTEPTDPEVLKRGNESLLLYDAIIPIQTENDGTILCVSNGAQTQLLKEEILRNIKGGISGNLQDILESVFGENPVVLNGIDLTSFEPDDPNFTPRISGILYKNEGALASVSKTDDSKKDLVVKDFKLVPGYANGIATYLGGNENPLKSFYAGSPLEYEISSNSADTIAQHFFNAISNTDGDKNYAVSVAVMMAPKNGLPPYRIINRFEK